LGWSRIGATSPAGADRRGTRDQRTHSDWPVGHILLLTVLIKILICFFFYLIYYYDFFIYDKNLKRLISLFLHSTYPEFKQFLPGLLEGIWPFRLLSSFLPKCRWTELCIDPAMMLNWNNDADDDLVGKEEEVEEQDGADWRKVREKGKKKKRRRKHRQSLSGVSAAVHPLFQLQKAKPMICSARQFFHFSAVGCWWSAKSSQHNAEGNLRATIAAWMDRRGRGRRLPLDKPNNQPTHAAGKTRN
jgi:hypothetical protein